MYATWKPERGEHAIIRLDDLAFISMTEANRDYRDYLVWLEDGNEPLHFTNASEYEKA